MDFILIYFYEYNYEAFNSKLKTKDFVQQQQK
jgi:hypothetical protein